MKPVEFSSTSNSILSQLPADVVGLILTFLPIKEAARTSILSTQWRHRWRSITQLVFDGNFANIEDTDFNYDSDYYDYGSDYWSESETETGLDEINKTMLKVNQALLVHDGIINKFELSIPGMYICPQLNELMHYLSTKSVNELALMFPNSDTYLSVPSSLFDFPNLSILKLERFTFAQSTCSVGFSKIVILELRDVKLPNESFEKLLPKCPLLQELRMLGCDADEEPVFVTSSLKVLLIYSTRFRSIYFMNTPHLLVLSVLGPRDNFHYMDNGKVLGKMKQDTVALFSSLPALEKLNLGLQLLLLLSEANDVPYQLPAPLHNLKFLQIPHLLLGRLKEVRVLACLIMSSPNLQKLTLWHDGYDNPFQSSDEIVSLQKLLEPGDHLGVCCLQQLEELNIIDSCGNQVELEFVRFVLGNAPVLKRVYINPKKYLCSDARLEFEVEVTHYKRISQEAEVEFIYW